jgi:hypothetical protein
MTKNKTQANTNGGKFQITKNKTQETTKCQASNVTNAEIQI